MRRQTKYDALVSADSPEEALEIAAEATPRGCSILASEVRDVSAEHGPGTWLVSLQFSKPN
ncbi:MAG: hypothetical protein ACPG4T_05815 [Nannocystaceae bacterium]